MPKGWARMHVMYKENCDMQLREHNNVKNNQIDIEFKK